MPWALLGGIRDEDVERLLSISRQRTFERGEVAFREGDPADTLHLIDEGRFAVRVATPAGETAIVAILGPGEMFGEVALLGQDDAQRSATVVALEPAQTRFVHRVDFEALRAEHPDTSDVIISILSGQVRRLSRQLLEALYVPPEKRVLRRLTEVAAVYESDVVPLTQEDLAELAGTSRKTVNRVLREEAGRGHLTIGRGRTTLLDVQALERRAR